MTLNQMLKTRFRRIFTPFPLPDGSFRFVKKELNNESRVSVERCL